LDEALDISLYLKPFKLLLDQIELVEFQYMSQHLASLMHVVCLTWSHSKYYCRPGRVAVLLQEICNFFIEKVSCRTVVFPWDSLSIYLRLFRVLFFGQFVFQ